VALRQRFEALHREEEKMLRWSHEAPCASRDSREHRVPVAGSQHRDTARRKLESGEAEGFIGIGKMLDHIEQGDCIHRRELRHLASIEPPALHSRETALMAGMHGPRRDFDAPHIEEPLRLQKKKAVRTADFEKLARRHESPQVLERGCELSP
jgi:hypothetical protein